MKTGAIIMKKIRNTMETPAPQIHHVRGRRRTTPENTIATTPPSKRFTSRMISWSRARDKRLCSLTVLPLTGNSPRRVQEERPGSCDNQKLPQ